MSPQRDLAAGLGGRLSVSTVQPQTGVVILTSQSATAPSPCTHARCDVHPAGCQCFGGNTTSDGLALVRTITNGAPLRPRIRS